jgi:hypothetical protein
MKLSEYAEEVKKLERGEMCPAWRAWVDGRYPGQTPDAEVLASAAAFLAREIRGCLWQPPYRAEAAELAARLDAVEVKGLAGV